MQNPSQTKTIEQLPELQRQIIDAIQDRKGHSVTLVDLSSVEGASVSSFIICEGNSPTQVAAIADNVREALQRNISVKPYNYDGYRNSQWIVIDYGDTLVHIFLPAERLRYNLEELWSDADITTVPDLD